MSMRVPRLTSLGTMNELLQPNSDCLPVFAAGTVIKGFGRGSKQLGCPTANFPQSVVQSLPDNLATGVYYGWASVNSDSVLKMVMNIGWCPYYKNKQKSAETHILHHFNEDFYGSTLKVCIVGYLRPEKNFTSLDDLIDAIKTDINNAEEALNKESCLHYKSHSFFSDNSVVALA